MKNIILILVLFCCLNAVAQTVDSVKIDTMTTPEQFGLLKQASNERKRLKKYKALTEKKNLLNAILREEKLKN